MPATYIYRNVLQFYEVALRRGDWGDSLTSHVN